MNHYQKEYCVVVIDLDSLSAETEMVKCFETGYEFLCQTHYQVNIEDSHDYVYLRKKVGD